MSLWRLVLKEIGHRRSNFVMGLLSVAVAVGCLVGAWALLQRHETRTGEIISAKEAEAQARADELENQIRKITKNMGFNIRILPKDQNLHDVYAQGFAEKTMPEAYATTLAKSDIVKIAHILPRLMRRVEWPEHKRNIVLIGVRGQVPQKLANPRKPIQQPVTEGTIVLGHELHRQLGLKIGDETTLLGHTFKVAKTHPARGDMDDITAWIHLATAQELLQQPGRINEILALECNCSSVDRLAEIRAEVQGILPDTQVIEFAGIAIARAEARKKTEADAKAAIAAERKLRGVMQREMEGFAAVLVPLAMLGSAVWIAFLALANVRSRSAEIGILRALGLGTRQILTLFLAKALLMGLGGACLGYMGGVTVGQVWGEGTAGSLLHPASLVLALVFAPLLALLASWIPATLAARQDPALVLGKE